MWDLALDGDTGDLIFGPSRDLLGASGPGLTQQRILTRCKIPRGSYTFDADGTLGSRLGQITSASSVQQIAQAPALIQEALEPMDDIRISDVQVSVTDDRRLLTIVKYSTVVSSDESADVIAEPTPDYDARVTV